MKHKIDILNLEWATDSRDTNIIDPVLVSLEDRYGYRVVRSSIWFFLFKLIYYRPKVVIRSGDIGADVNVLFYHIANKLGIITIAFIGEGLQIYSYKGIKQKEWQEVFYWGDNRRHEHYTDLKFLWSEESRQVTYDYVKGSLNHNIHVSGGTGFDRYTLLPYNKSKDKLKNKYGIKYKKVVLIVGYSFDLFPPLFNADKPGFNIERLKWLYSQRNIIRDEYEKVISAHEDTLFILKYHPGSINWEENELYGINERHKNVMVLCSEIEIGQLIAMADILLTFDSTTCMEAWLIGRPTIMLNPLGLEWDRSIIYKGCVITRSANEINDLIDEFYSLGTMQAYEDKMEERKKCIKSLIQSSDGANYLRASSMINKYLGEHPKKSSAMTKKEYFILLKELIVEIKRFIVEYTPFGCLRKESRDVYRSQTNAYDKNKREKAVNNFRKWIGRFEKNNEKLVSEILKSGEN